MAAFNELAQLKEKMASFAQKIYKYAPTSFRLVIDRLIDRGYESENLKTVYLKDLNEYFSSFDHYSFDDSDTDEMTNWVNAILHNKPMIVRSYKINGSQKQITIKLAALNEIIDLCVAEQKKNDDKDSHVIL